MIHRTSVLFAICIAISSPVLAIDSDRAEVRDFIEKMGRDYGFDTKSLARLLSQAQTRQNILDAISRPAERVVPWHEYRAQFVNERRIDYGKQFQREHARTLNEINDAQLQSAVLGILGVETSYGRITGRFRVIDALTTLAFDYPPRSAFFREELGQFLLLCREEGLDPLTAQGSYAGAMGAPQFISSSYRKYAVDGDGDERRDLWSSWDDVIASVANYLRAFGWRRGEPVFAEASVAGVDLAGIDTTRIALNETVGSLQKKGVKFVSSLPDAAPAMLIVAEGTTGPVYRVGFNNFYVITRYNRSTKYAMAVHELGNAVVGGSP